MLLADAEGLTRGDRAGLATTMVGRPHFLQHGRELSCIARCPTAKVTFNAVQKVRTRCGQTARNFFGCGIDRWTDDDDVGEFANQKLLAAGCWWQSAVAEHRTHTQDDEDPLLIARSCRLCCVDQLLHPHGYCSSRSSRLFARFPGYVIAIFLQNGSRLHCPSVSRPWCDW